MFRPFFIRPEKHCLPPPNPYLDFSFETNMFPGVFFWRAPKNFTTIATFPTFLANQALAAPHKNTFALQTLQINFPYPLSNCSLTL